MRHPGLRRLVHSTAIFIVKPMRDEKSPGIQGHTISSAFKNPRVHLRNKANEYHSFALLNPIIQGVVRFPRHIFFKVWEVRSFSQSEVYFSQMGLD